MEWFEEDGFWESFDVHLFPPERWEKTPEEVDQVIALLDLAEPAPILDLCCGPGRHSLELARRGFQMTSVDRTPRYLARARAASQREDLAIEFVQEDMRRFQRPAAFAAVVNLFTSFGYFEDPADDLSVLRNMHAALKPGGKILLEMMGKEILARIFRERIWWPTEEGGFYLQEHTLTEDWSWIENRWILIERGETKEFRVAHRIYSAAELKGLLAEAGFTRTCAYGSLAGDPYDHAAKRLVVVGEKA